MFNYRTLPLATLSLLVAACTQNPAAVVYRGDQSYGRDNAYVENLREPRSSVHKTAGFTPEFNNRSYTEDAPMSSVGVNELAPLTVEPAAPVSVSPSRPIEMNSLGSREPVRETQSIASAPVEAPKVVANNDHTLRVPTRTQQLSQKKEAVTPAPRLAEAAPVHAFDAAPKVAAAEKPTGFIWPVQGEVISTYGEKTAGQFNDGINIASGEGEPVWSVADGEVIYVGNNHKDFGNMVMVQHKDGLVSSYAHASAIAVKKGDKIKQGQLVAYVGSTGSVKSAQLYFSVRKNKEAVNPIPYLNNETVAGIAQPKG